MAVTDRAPRMRRSTTADGIKDLILSRHLQSGDPLPTEAELCEALDVSRSSVREAVRALATLDIVEVRHGHGTFVGRMSLDPMVQALVFRGALSTHNNVTALREVVEIRQALDLAMAEQIVAGLAGTKHEELHRLTSEMAARADAGEDFFEADRAFHTTLFTVVDNQLAGQLVGAFWDVHSTVVPMLARPLDLSDLRRTAKAHRAILTAAEGGDLDAFRRAIRRHYAPLVRALETD